MDQTQVETLIVSIKGTSLVSKAPPVYDRNPGQLYAKSIINYGSSVGANRCRYVTARISITKFDHTTGKVLEITTSLTERSDKYGWVSGTGSIT